MNSSLDTRAFEFFKLFTKFEYALKRMGHIRSNRSELAEVDWDSFASLMDGNFKDHPELKESINYLFEHPPKKQIVREGKLDWSYPGTEKSTQALFGHIRRVRNNLYHGAKFNDHWISPERSLELINHSINILEYIRANNSELDDTISKSHT